MTSERVVYLLSTTVCSVDGWPGRGFDCVYRNGWETNASKEGEILKLKKNAGIRTSERVFMLEMMQMCLMVRRNSLQKQWGQLLLKWNLINLGAGPADVCNSTDLDWWTHMVILGPVSSVPNNSGGFSNLDKYPVLSEFHNAFPSLTSCGRKLCGLFIHVLWQECILLLCSIPSSQQMFLYCYIW